MNFGVFAAVKQNGKYLLASPSGKAGQIVQSDYQSLLAKYNQSHGNIGRLSSATAEYGRILNYICLYEGRFADYYVREIRKDNKYAVVVFSTTGNTANIKEYVLKNDNGFWEVVYPNVQMDAYPITAINRLIPDFNVEVLPKYNLAAWRGLVKAEQGGRSGGNVREVLYYQQNADSVSVCNGELCVFPPDRRLSLCCLFQRRLLDGGTRFL